MVTTLFVAGGISGGLRGCHVVLHACMHRGTVVGPFGR